MPDAHPALDLVEELLALPTAPFVEDLPARYVLDRAAAVPGLESGRGAARDLLLRGGGGGPGRAPPALLPPGGAGARGSGPAAGARGGRWAAAGRYRPRRRGRGAGGRLRRVGVPGRAGEAEEHRGPGLR